MVSLYRFQNYWNFDLEWKHGKRKTAFRARKVTGTFEELAPGQEPITKTAPWVAKCNDFIEFCQFRNKKDTGLSYISQRLLGLSLGTRKKIGRHIPSNVPRNNCGTHFGSSSLLDSKVAKGKVDPSLDLVSLCVLTETLYHKLPLISFPTYWLLPHLPVNEKIHPITSLPDTPPLWIQFIMTFCSLIKKRKKNNKCKLHFDKQVL